MTWLIISMIVLLILMFIVIPFFPHKEEDNDHPNRH